MATVFTGRAAVRIIVTAVAVIDHAAMVKQCTVKINRVMAVITDSAARNMLRAFAGVDDVVMAAYTGTLDDIAVVDI